MRAPLNPTWRHKDTPHVCCASSISGSSIPVSAPSSDHLLRYLAAVATKRWSEEGTDSQVRHFAWSREKSFWPSSPPISYSLRRLFPFRRAETKDQLFPSSTFSLFATQEQRINWSASDKNVFPESGKVADLTVVSRSLICCSHNNLLEIQNTVIRTNDRTFRTLYRRTLSLWFWRRHGRNNLRS